VEPARNIAAIARRRGIATVEEFFDAEVGRQLRARSGPAKAVVANNVLAHVDDPAGFLQGMAALLDERGLAIIEVPYLAEMLERLEYDTVYHEHLSYFSVTALLRLFERGGLRVLQVDRVPVHGGSIRVYAGLSTTAAGHAEDVLALSEAERSAGLASLPRFRRFSADVAANRSALLAVLERLHAEGRALAAYGAPAKGNTLLNYCGIGPRLVRCAFDKSPHKVGRFTPGMHLPVLPAAAIESTAPEYLLLLAWNFAEEVMAQQAAFRARGGKFILPIPLPVVV
jgi:hypothetical protein